LSAVLPDLAPYVPNTIKNLVYAVYTNGASNALREGLNGSLEDRERAVKIAVRNLTEAFITRDMVV